MPADLRAKSRSEPPQIPVIRLIEFPQEFLRASLLDSKTTVVDDRPGRGRLQGCFVSIASNVVALLSPSYIAIIVSSKTPFKLVRSPSYITIIDSWKTLFKLVRCLK